MTENGGATEEKGLHKGIVYGAVGLTAVALAGYIGMCTKAQTSDHILNNVTINDVQVGGMSKSQAISAVTDSLEEQIKAMSIVYVQDDWNGILQGDIAQVKIESAVDQAYSLGKENFLTGGLAYLSGVSGEQSQIYIPLEFNETGRTQFELLLDEAEEKLQGSVIQASWTVDLEEGVLLFHKGVSGASINRDDAEVATLTALSSGSSNNQVPLVMKVTAPTEPDFQGVRDSIYSQPVSAQLDHNLNISDHVMGVDVDSVAVANAYANAQEGETFTVPLILTEPEETTEVLRGYLFADVLATSSTHVIGTTPRRNNVALATSFCNEVVVLPGENFSFYENCAPYSTGNGYGVATAYVAGKTVNEVAGGICQVASVIYHAILHTEIEVVERRAHQFTVDYLPQAMDATIYSTSTDFKFKNNTGYPLKILAETTYTNGNQYTNITILGTQTSDVTIVPKSTVYNYTTQPTQYEINTSLPVGSSQTVQTAYTGCTSTLTRYHYDVDGNLIKEEVMHTDRYNSRPAIIQHNPGTGSEVETPSAEPEYVAPDYVEPEYVAPEYVAPEYVEPEYVAPEYVEPEYVAPEYVVPEYVEPEYVAPEYVEPQAPTVEPLPQETLTPDPVPQVTVTPDPVPEITVTPDPVPQVTVTPDPVPEVVVPQETVTPEPVPEVVVTPDPVPEPVVSETTEPTG